jgi:hypothetical protein
LEAQEKNVGPFRADILCKNTSGDCRKPNFPKNPTQKNLAQVF